MLQVLPLAQSAVAARLEIAPALPGNRDLLYLDLALEDVVRSAAERGASALGIGAAAFVGPLLQNLVRPRLAMHVDIHVTFKFWPCPQGRGIWYTSSNTIASGI